MDPRLEDDWSFEELDQRRAFEKIISQIEGAIVSGRLRPGDRLPGEREFAEMFGASRASVREALRVLDAFGVVVAQRGTGPKAGSTIAAGAQSGLQSALRLNAGLLRIPTQDIIDVRAVLEGRAAQLAATNSQPADIVRLRGIIDVMRAVDEVHVYHDLDTAFHIELARASGSELLPVLMEALRGSVRRVMLEGFAALNDWRAARDQLVEEHAHVVDCIEARDPVEAEVAVREHVLRFYRHVLEGRNTQTNTARRKPRGVVP